MSARASTGDSARQILVPGVAGFFVHGRRTAVEIARAQFRVFVATERPHAGV